MRVCHLLVYELYVCCLYSCTVPPIVAQPIASSPTQPAAPLNAATGMTFAHTHPIPWPEMQDTSPPAQSDLFLKDVSVTQVLTPGQAASTDPASGPSWTLSPPNALQVLAQAGTASSNSISHKPLDYFKAAVDEGLPHGSRSQIGTTTHSGGQAQPAPASSKLNHLAVPWDPVLGLSKALPHVHSNANTLTAPTCGHLSSGARAMSPPPGYPHIMPQWPQHNVAAGGDLNTSESGMSDDEDESGMSDDEDVSGMSDDEDESAAHLRLPSYPKCFVRKPVFRSSGARAVSPPPGFEHIMPHPHDNVAAGGDLGRDGERAADPGGKPERPRCQISEKGKRRSKARALKKKKARRQARLLREQQMQSAGT